MTTANNPPIAGLRARIRSVADIRSATGQLWQLRSAVVRREAYALPDLIAAAAAKPAAANANAVGAANAHREITRLLRRTRMRVRRLLKAIIRAMSDEPNPPTFIPLVWPLPRPAAKPGNRLAPADDGTTPGKPDWNGWQNSPALAA